VKDRDRHDRQPAKHASATGSAQETARFPIEYIKFKKVVRQPVIETGVLRIEPFAEHDVAATEHLAQRIGVNGCPGLQEIEVPFAVSADQKMSAALQPQRPLRIERNGTIGTIYLFLDDKKLVRQFRNRLVVPKITFLQPRPFQVPRARIFQ